MAIEADCNMIDVMISIGSQEQQEARSTTRILLVWREVGSEGFPSKAVCPDSARFRLVGVYYSSGLCSPDGLQTYFDLFPACPGAPILAGGGVGGS